MLADFDFDLGDELLFSLKLRSSLGDLGDLDLVSDLGDLVLDLVSSSGDLDLDLDLNLVLDLVLGGLVESLPLLFCRILGDDHRCL